MKQSSLVKLAVQRGRKSAESVVKSRRAQLEKRAAAVAAPRVRKLAAKARAGPSARAMKAAGPRPAAGVLVAEGDSWFDYPGRDVLRALEVNHGFDVESVSHRGDRMEAMAYADDQLEDFARCIEKQLRNGEVPRAILLSGGGNDIAGNEFHLLLNHALSPIAGVSESVARGIIDERIRFAYIHIISAITALCERIADVKIPILTHGYGYPVPDGRGVLGGWLFLPGPWLKPGFHDKGFVKPAQNARHMRQLIDQFNDMLIAVAGLPGFGHVHYVNLRATLPSGKNYKTYWANEMHPTRLGFDLVAAEIARAVP